MPVQGQQVSITSGSFTLTPATGDSVGRFDRVVLSNQSGYQLVIATGSVTRILEPWTKDIFKTYKQALVIAPRTPSAAQIAPGARSYLQSEWYQPGEADSSDTLPSTIAQDPTIAASSPGVAVSTSKQFWSMGKDSLAITNTDTVLNLNQRTGWGTTVTTGTSYTVPTGKQLVITNVQVCGRPLNVSYQCYLRSATAPLTSVTEMVVFSLQPDQRFGSPTTGVDPGAQVAYFYGDNSLVIPAGGVVAFSAKCGAANSFIDVYAVGYLQDVA